jgi:hypothetical protein
VEQIVDLGSRKEIGLARDGSVYTQARALLSYGHVRMGLNNVQLGIQVPVSPLVSPGLMNEAFSCGLYLAHSQYAPNGCRLPDWSKSTITE